MSDEAIQLYEETAKHYRQKLLGYGRMCLVTGMSADDLKRVMRLQMMNVLPEQQWTERELARADALAGECVQCWEVHKLGAEHGARPIDQWGRVYAGSIGADNSVWTGGEAPEAPLCTGPDSRRSKYVLAAYFEGLAEGLRR